MLGTLTVPCPFHAFLWFYLIQQILEWYICGQRVNKIFSLPPLEFHIQFILGRFPWQPDKGGKSTMLHEALLGVQSLLS